MHPERGRWGARGRGSDYSWQAAGDTGVRLSADADTTPKYNLTLLYLTAPALSSQSRDPREVAKAGLVKLQGCSLPGAVACECGSVLGCRGLGAPARWAVAVSESVAAGGTWTATHLQRGCIVCLENQEISSERLKRSTASTIHIPLLSVLCRPSPFPLPPLSSLPLSLLTDQRGSWATPLAASVKRKRLLLTAGCVHWTKCHHKATGLTAEWTGNRPQWPLPVGGG